MCCVWDGVNPSQMETHVRIMLSVGGDHMREDPDKVRPGFPS